MGRREEKGQTGEHTLDKQGHARPRTVLAPMDIHFHEDTFKRLRMEKIQKEKEKEKDSLGME